MGIIEKFGKNLGNGIANSLGSGIVGLGLGTIKGAIQKDQQENSQKEIADYNNKLARQNALDKWSLEKASMQKAGINMSAINGMQTANIPALTPAPAINNEQPTPSIAEGAKQVAETKKTETEEELNNKFIEQSGDYWSSQTAERLANAKESGAKTIWTALQTKTQDYEFAVRQACINAYGGTSEYGKAMLSKWKSTWDNIEANTKNLMSQAGLNEAKCQQAIQDTINSKEMVKIAWYNAIATKAYNMGMLHIAGDRLEFDKNSFKGQLGFEIDKFNRTLNLDFQKFNWQKGMDNVAREYQRQLIKSEEQMRFWKPIVTLSQCFRDVGIGFSAFGNGLNSFKGFMSKPMQTPTPMGPVMSEIYY